MLTWEELFKKIESQDYWTVLQNFLDFEYKNFTIYPPKDKIFNAFKLTTIDNLKVVIIGQDPYHEPNQAMGLSFSVPNETKCPPSLINIYKEIEIETNKKINKKGDLTYLAEQGVFLLNTILTVRKGQPLSHNIKEYQLLLKDILKFLNDLDQPIVYMLWGGFAQKFEKYLTNPKHLIIKRTHPSPLGANRGGWFNCNQFIECNEFLKQNNVKEIEWVK